MKTTNPETLREALNVALEALAWLSVHGKMSDSIRATDAYHKAQSILHGY